MLLSQYRRGRDDDRPSKRRDTGREKGITRSPIRAKSPPIKVSDNAVTQSPQASKTPMLAQDDPRTAWLSVLTREELAHIAAGPSWQTGDAHTNRCFACKLGSMLLNCQNCSRSYHSTCLDPPIKFSAAPKDWTCPACALLDGEGATHVYLLGEPCDGQNSRRMVRFEGASKMAQKKFKVDGGTPNSKDDRQHDDENFQTGSNERKRRRSSASAAYDKGKSSLNGAELVSENSLDTKAQLASPTQSSTAMTDPTSFNPFGISANTSHKPDPGKQSRYTTLPPEVDSALATLNRQLEAGAHSQNILEQVTARNRTLEQELKIERGKALLTRPAEMTDEGARSMRVSFQKMEQDLSELRRQNQQLRKEAEDYRRKIKELEAWKLRMKAMIDEHEGV